MRSARQSIKQTFPLWSFLTQPLFSSNKLFLSPFRFWQHYNMQYLEQCWDVDPVSLLERCWAKPPEINFPADQTS